MKAIVQDRYGVPDDVLRLATIKPPAVDDDDVLVRVHAASVHPDVWHVVRGFPYALRLMGSGLRRPRIRVPGTDLAGCVVGVGASVTRFRPGDEVFGESVRGHQWQNGGAYAEYAAVPERGLALKPANVTFEQAAAVPTSGLIALFSLRDEGRLQAGQSVLINGAGGGVGSIAVQLAKAFGATVTGVDGPTKLALIRSLGADHVIDYTVGDFTRRDERYDLILDIPGNHPFAECRRALTANGVYVLVGHDQFVDSGNPWLGRGLPRALSLLAMAPFVSQLPRPTFSMPDKQTSLELLRDLLATGQITPIIDRTFPLDAVPEAIRYLEAGHTLGKVIITI